MKWNSWIFFLLFLGLSRLLFARDGDGLWYEEEPRKTIAVDPQSVDPLAPGDDIPFGTLRSPEGKAVDLEGLVRGKATIILFYQGEWSPSANKQLDQLAGIMPDLIQLGFQVIAISPDQPAKLQETLRHHPLNNPLFCDSTMEVTQRFGVAYRADLKALGMAGVRLEDYTGNSRDILPVPSVFGIDLKGVIRFVYFNVDPNNGFNGGGLLQDARELRMGNRPVGVPE